MIRRLFICFEELVRGIVRGTVSQEDLEAGIFFLLVPATDPKSSAIRTVFPALSPEVGERISSALRTARREGRLACPRIDEDDPHAFWEGLNALLRVHGLPEFPDYDDALNGAGFEGVFGSGLSGTPAPKTREAPLPSGVDAVWL